MGFVMMIARNGEYIYFWKTRGLPDKRVNSITAFDYGITPELSYFGNKMRIIHS